MNNYYVYILASGRNGTLYIGMTNDLIRRVSEHRQEMIPGFTRTYHIHTLVYFEQGNDVGGVIKREKQLKTWKRKWKLALIEQTNPEWNDLWDEIV
jgi:putative endonuclease